MTTKAEKERMDRVANLGCIVCRLYYQMHVPANIHHLTGLKYRSMGKKAKEYIPLCPTHHQYGNHMLPSVHSHPKLFKEKYGSQEHLLNRTNELLKHE